MTTTHAHATATTTARTTDVEDLAQQIDALSTCERAYSYDLSAYYQRQGFPLDVALSMAIHDQQEAEAERYDRYPADIDADLLAVAH